MAWTKRINLSLIDGVWTANFSLATDEIPVTKPELKQAIRTLEQAHRAMLAQYTLHEFRKNEQKRSNDAADAPDVMAAASSA